MNGAASAREGGIVLALALLPLLPFLGAAISIDAPVFLAVTRQILVHPLDPFGFDMIWDPSSPHVAHWNHNPPLLSYWLAPFVGAFGEREWVLHAAVLPFPALAALAFLGIARRVSGGPAMAPVALLVATPAFLLLATTLLLDVPMLALLLLAVYALLRARESGSAGWEVVAGLAAAAAGLTKYVGFATAPLLAAGVLLLPGPGRAWRSCLRVAGIPVLCWAVWGVFTQQLYGAPHFAGGVALVGSRSLDPDHFWNQLLSLPVYYAGALLFPAFAAVRGLRRAAGGVELIAAGLLAGTAAVLIVLPEGEPPRRVALAGGEAVLGAWLFASAVVCWGLALRAAGLRSDPVGRFLALWLMGFLVFSGLVNWHVNGADALLAAPPLILLWFRSDALRPGAKLCALWVGVGLGFSLLLTVSDARQRAAYRDAGQRIAREIGERAGARWFVGHWGFQYYLEREGFQAVVPAQYERSYGTSELARGDWIASARNVSQLDVSRNLSRFRVRSVWDWSYPARLPLRATNPDAGAGFYSHHVGYLPFTWSHTPLEQIALARVQ